MKNVNMQNSDSTVETLLSTQFGSIKEQLDELSQKIDEKNNYNNGVTDDIVLGAIDESGYPVFVFNQRRELLRYSNQHKLNLGLPSKKFEQAITQVSNFVFGDSNKENGIRINGKLFLTHIQRFPLQDTITVTLLPNLELEEKEELLHINQEKYRTIVERSGDVIIKMNSVGEIIYLNSNATRCLGLDKSRAIGLSLFQMVEADYLDEYQAFLKGDNKGLSFVEVPVDVENGPKVWLRQFVLRVDDDQNNYLTISSDITHEKILNKSLVKSEDRYKKIAKSMRLGLIEMDIVGRLTYVNSGIEDLFGMLPDEVLGKNISDLICKDKTSLRQLEEHIEWLQQGKDHHVELVMKTNTEDVYLLMNSTPRFSENGEQSGIMSSLMDISNQKRDQDRILKHATKVKEEADDKELFLANMSHEMRTPLNAIIGISRLLGETELNTKQKEYSGIVNTSATNLKSIIDSILDLTKINTGNVILENNPFQISDLLSYCKSANELNAQENGNELNYKLDSQISQFLMGDSVRLGQIINNLLSNAVKFTKEGRVDLKATLLKDNLESQLISISVKDTGIGIDKKNIEKILMPFTQEDASTTRRFGGTGLGLTISANLLRMQGSKLEVQSNLGEGSVFSFKIELNKTQTVTSNDIETVNPKLISDCKILVVDDNPFNQTLIEGVLQPTQVDLSFTNDGLEALEFLKEEVVDVILMDIQMPVMNGLECSEKIRQELKLDIPIICISANAMAKDIQQYFTAGMNDYITKPFEPADLIKKIAKWVGSTQSDLELVELLSDEETKEEQLFTLEKLEDMLSNNRAFVRQSLDTLLEHTPEVLKEMEKAVLVDDYESISKLAHRLIATVKILDVQNITNSLVDLETKIYTMERQEVRNKIELVVGVMKKVLKQIHNLEYVP